MRASYYNITYLPFEHVTPHPRHRSPSAGRVRGPRWFTSHPTRPAISHRTRFAFPFSFLMLSSPPLVFLPSSRASPSSLTQTLPSSVCLDTCFVPPSPIFHHDQGPSSSSGHWSRWCVFLSFSFRPGFTFLGLKLLQRGLGLFVYLYCSVFLLVFFWGFRLWLWDVVGGAWSVCKYVRWETMWGGQRMFGMVKIWW